MPALTLDGEPVTIDGQPVTWGENEMTLYPSGYNTAFTTLEQQLATHGPKMHPTFRRNLFDYLEHKAGLLGIGGGWRATQPPKPGFAPEGKSFHQDQTFASGVVGYCAVDLVARNGAAPHRSPTWAECADAAAFGLHTFITGEPWHIQPINIRGWQSWVDAGRPDPEDDDMTPENPPRRLLDTRPLPGKIPTGTPVTVECGVIAKAVAVNITVTETDGPGFLTAWGAGAAPGVSNVNYDRSGQTIANHSVVPLDGSLIRFQLGGAAAHVIVDLQGVYG